MAKGIIYVMTSVVPGLIKIGKTGSNNFDSRMIQLEKWLFQCNRIQA